MNDAGWGGVEVGSFVLSKEFGGCSALFSRTSKARSTRWRGGLSG